MELMTAADLMQVHRVRLRLAKLPHRVVTRAEMMDAWPLTEHDWCIVCAGSVQPGGKHRREFVRDWHNGWYSFITPDGVEHVFKTGRAQSRYNVLLKEAKALNVNYLVHGVRRREDVTFKINWADQP